jgi:protein TonB
VRTATILLLASLAGSCRTTPAGPGATPAASAAPDDAPRFANSAWRQTSTPRETVSPARIDLPRFAGGDFPLYPEVSVRRHEQGAVDLRFELRENGSVRDVGIDRSSGFSSLDAAALAAARTWRFYPTTGGSETEVLRYRLQFRLVDG